MNTLKKYRMKDIRISIFSILLLILLPLVSNATHIVGGDITYKYLGPGTAAGQNKYQITLVVRRDCSKKNGKDNNEPFDKKAFIAIFKDEVDGAGNPIHAFFKQLEIPYASNNEVDGTIESNCGFEGEQICYQETKYVDVVSLPTNPRGNGGYTFTYQRCCRNGTLVNIQAPLETGSTYTVYLSKKSFELKNSSPKFDNWPNVYLCVNEDLNFISKTSDVDGDSIAYKLCTPFSGLTKSIPIITAQSEANAPPYNLVSYTAPFSLANLMGGVPLAINAKTGLMTAKPNAIGQYVATICIEEWRNGVKLSEVRRDFQYNTRVCSPPPTAIFEAPANLCNEKTIAFVNKSISSQVFKWSFNVPSTDPAFKSTLKDPTFTFPGNGTYNVKLFVQRNSDKCADSITKTIKITDLPYNADFDYDIKACNPDGTISVVLTDKSTTADVGAVSNKWNWVLTQGSVTKTSTTNPAEFVINPGNFSVKFDVDASNACKGTVSRNVIYNTKVFESDFKVALDGCDANNNLMIKLTDLSQDLNDNYTVTDRKWTVTYGTTTIPLSGNDVVVSIPRVNYTVTLDVNTNKNCKNTVTKNFKITDFLPIADFNFVLSGCDLDNKAIITLTENSNDAVQYATVSAYKWKFKDQNLNGNTIEYITSLRDSFDVKMTIDFANNCQTDTSKTISVNQLRPKVQYTYSAVECPTDSTVDLLFTYINTGNQGLNNDGINWNIGNVTDIQTYTGNTIKITLPKDSTIYGSVKTKFSNGCIDEVEKTFLPGPFATLKIISDSLTLCPLEKKNLITSGNPALTYTWTPTLGLDLSNPANPILTADKDQIYNVIVNDGLCSVKGKVVVDVLEAIKLDIDGSQNTCDGSVNLKGLGAVGPGSYVWYKDAAATQKVGEGETLATSFNTGEQIYYLQFNATSVCKAIPSSIKVINQTPILDVIGPYKFCTGDTIKTNNVFNQVPGHTNSYTWNTDPHIVSGGNTINPTVGTINNTEKDFTLYFKTKNQFGCELNDSLRFEIIPNPVVDFAFNVKDCNTNEVCFKFNTNAQLFGLPKWSFGDSKTAPGANGVEVCNKYNSTGEYKVVLSNLTDLCPFKDVVKTLKLNATFQVFDKDNAENCIDKSYTLMLPAKAVGRDFKWLDIDGKLLSTEANPKVDIKSDTSFVLNVKDDNGCPFNDTFFIKAFVYDLALDVQDTVCKEGTYTIKATANPGINFAYVWTPANAIVSNGTTANPTVDVSKATKYTAKLTHPTLGCTTEKSIEFNLFKFENKIEIPVEVCETGIYEIKASSTSGANTYEWMPASAVVSGGNTATPKVDVAKSSKFTTKTTNVKYGCVTEESVEFKKFIFDAMLDVPQLFCIKSTVQPTINVKGTIGYLYEWTPNELIVSGGNTASPTVSVTGENLIKVKVTHPTLGCILKDSFRMDTSALDVTVNANPSGDVTKGALIDIFVENPNPAFTYKWSNGFVGVKQGVIVESDTSFTVTALDPKGCEGTATIRLKIRDPKCEEDVFIPTAFSPNGDGTNDQLFVRSSYIDVMELIIYNRWGQQVFTTKDIKIGWDGTFGGDELAPDVFAYWLVAKCSDGAEIKRRGNVSILR